MFENSMGSFWKFGNYFCICIVVTSFLNYGIYFHPWWLNLFVRLLNFDFIILQHVSKEKILLSIKFDSHIENDVLLYSVLFILPVGARILRKLKNDPVIDIRL